VDRAVPALSDLSMPEFESLVSSWGKPTVHARKLLRRYYMGSGMVEWDRIELPKGFRERVETLGLLSSSVAARQEDPDGTVKLLLRLADGQTVETVLMADVRSDRAAGCLSTQVGCAMGCDFCATGKAGFVRNLTAGEIVEQFFHLRREAARAGKELRTIVMMGMGEPLQNLGAVVPAAHRIGWGELGAVGFAQITVSTVGLVPKIDELAASGVPVALALSLHAPDDATRQRLLPTARRYGIEEVLAAADRYQETTGRVVNIQYCLLRGVNDSPEQARQLAALLEKRRMHLNLLTYNPTGPGLSGVAYEPPPRETVGVFLDELHARGIVAHFRRPRGATIDGACGQLRARTGG
jgi:23S rRNA (adenine2503-C2)-methyltransferase